MLLSLNSWNSLFCLLIGYHHRNFFGWIYSVILIVIYQGFWIQFSAMNFFLISDWLIICFKCKQLLQQQKYRNYGFAGAYPTFWFFSLRFCFCKGHVHIYWLFHLPNLHATEFVNSEILDAQLLCNMIMHHRRRSWTIWFAGHGFKEADWIDYSLLAILTMLKLEDQFQVTQIIVILCTFFLTDLLWQ